MSDGYRQEVLNVELARLLQKRGIVSTPENILHFGGGRKKKMPDVIVTFEGLRTVIEAEVGDAPDAQQRALQSAAKRVEDGIAYIGVAIVYPPSLRYGDYAKIEAELAASQLDIAIVTESGHTQFTSGNVDYLRSALYFAFDQLVKEDVVAKAVQSLKWGIEHFADMVVVNEGDVARLAEALGIRSATAENEDEEAD